MADVYFSKDIEEILNKFDYSRLGKNVAIKVHFGEKGCITHINPELVRKVYNKIISLGKKAVLVECNVLYKGSRTTKEEHLKTAKEHGFVGMDIDILDGEKGEEFIEVDGCKLGKGLKKYDSMIVLSHFKGHMMTGFGGAFKNIGMGLGSRAGKLHMHSTVNPSISKRCTGCQACIKGCDVNSISLVNGKAKISQEKCIGCAMCIALCPVNAISIPWQSETSEGLQKKIIDYTKAVFKVIPKEKCIFINVLENITEDCDCLGKKQSPQIEDIGILASSDILSIEKASLDLANKSGFEKVQKHIDKNSQIDYAKSLGEEKYKIIN